MQKRVEALLKATNVYHNDFEFFKHRGDLCQSTHTHTHSPTRQLIYTIKVVVFFVALKYRVAVCIEVYLI